MRRFFRNGFSILVAAAACQGAALAVDPVCTAIDASQVRCAITTIADCDAINDTPYARNLFCPAAFSAAQEIAARLATTLGAAGPSSGFFYYYQQSPPDGESQTTIGCVGAGDPLCHLVAYATSVGPVPPHGADPANPVPDPLRGYPDYFGKLYAPTPAFPLTQFKTGSVFDPVVEGLGSAGHDAFVADYPAFSTTALYDPDHWHSDHQYRGISGGGGGGWGGEIAVLGARGEPATLLAFGGGGGGGMTSFQRSPTAVATALGAGGGGGMQFGSAFRVKNKNYNGLGLGAGTGSDESSVQYSYNDYAGSGRPPQPTSKYNAAVIADYKAQLVNLSQQLKTRYEGGKPVVLMGGGGTGGGTEYLMLNGQEYEPHALSTQAGFQFSYEFQLGKAQATSLRSSTLGKLQADQESFYDMLGEDFRVAHAQAFDECGRDYSNYACMCPREHAIVICLAEQQLGDPSEIPSWLQEQHCGNEPAKPADNGFTSYQQLLLGTEHKVDSPCARALREYFTRVNSPVNVHY